MTKPTDAEVADITLSVKVIISNPEGYKDKAAIDIQTKTQCKSIAWEQELIWQIAKAVSDFHGDDKVALTELEAVVDQLKKRLSA